MMLLYSVFLWYSFFTAWLPYLSGYADDVYDDDDYDDDIVFLFLLKPDRQ